MKKTLAAILAVLTLALPLAGCSKDNAASETTDALADAVITDADDSGEEAPKGRAGARDNLPELDFDGQSIVILHRNNPIIINTLQGENNGGDVLRDAVYTRNKTVEDRLNLKIEFKMGNNFEANHGELGTVAEKDILAGDAEWDFMLNSAQVIFAQAINGYFADVYDMPYIDIDQPWWWTELMNEQSIETSRRYILNGDFTLYTLMRASAGYFNKAIFTDVYGDIDELYNLVRDGKWTFERFLEYCEGAYADLNGDGVRDDGDTYGYRATYINEAVNYPTMSCGLKTHVRDEDGYPMLDLYNDNWVKWAEYMYDYAKTDKYGKMGENSKKGYEYFAQGSALFFLGTLSEADEFRNTEFDYGIIPYPVFSEEYEYTSAAATPNSDSVAVPVTTPVEKYNIIGAALEALSAESYRTVTEKYYETTLKGKYLGSEKDIEMVDIIYNSINTNFVMVAAKELGGVIGSMFVYVCNEANGNLTSYWEANQEAFETKMDTMIDKYLGLK